MAKQRNDNDTLDILDGRETVFSYDRIRELMKAKELSVAKLGERLNCSRQHVSKVIKDEKFRAENRQWEYALRYVLENKI